MSDLFDYESKPLENLPPQTQYVTYIPYGMTPQEFEERKEVKKLANTIGGSLLVVLAIINNSILSICQFYLFLIILFIGYPYLVPVYWLFGSS